MTKSDLIKELEAIEGDPVVIVSDGSGWSNIENIEMDGCQIAIMMEKYPVFSEN